MATNFTNKYMQVFQDYNEFSEHSADYVRGEDHIAFLIEENEVIYWLYLEQVWRPLNVRTTTTGQLEDGRTKVAVRLEYIEGGQKYTSVPNIPDPERITSMGRFLEDYPDIEEVNVSGTVNLNDLSSAFAGSKIKDFSMLDTSNVIYFDNIFSNIKDETRDLTLKINQSANNIIARDIILNNLTIESTNNEVTSTIKLGESDIKNSLIIKGNINFGLVDYGFYVYNFIESDADINLLNGSISFHNTYTDYNKIICKQLTIGWNNINNNNTGYAYKTYCDKIIIEDGNNNGYSLRDYRKIECYNIKEFELKTSYDNFFGGGIKFNNSDNIKITINGINNVGNFWFTTPIVDDAFYAKYAKYNTPISIFQYKTTFEEVADVNISSEVDSSLLYINWYLITWDTNNMSIEINNIADLTSMSIYTSRNFKKFILDNRTLVNDDNIPSYYNINITANDGYISGKFKAPTYNWSYGESGAHSMTLYENTLFKDVVLYDYSRINIRNNDVFTTNNIKIDKLNAKLYSRIIANSDDSKEIDLYNLKDNNNIVNCSLYSYENNILKYYEDISLNINDADIYIKGIINYINKENNNNFTGIINFDRYDSFSVEEEYNKLSEEVYINSNEEIQIDNFINKISKTNSIIRNYVTSIFGNNITIIIPTSPSSNMDLSLKPSIANDAFKHIDITKSKCDSAFIIGYYITIFVNLDTESTINLITKLVDNTANSSKTIYMYRSQANIIGEENIAGAVAKNYEIAIIEN